MAAWLDRLPFGYNAYIGTGYRGSEKQVVLTPLDWRGDGTVRGVVVAHGLLGDAHGWRIAMDELRWFVAAGIPVISADLGGFATWGNDDTVAAIEDAYSYLKAFGVSHDGFIGYGQSMGGVGLLNYILARPNRVAAFVGQVPGIGLDEMHDRSAAAPSDPVIGALAGSIEAAFGGLAAYNAAMPGKDPYGSANVDKHAALNIPMRIYASKTDPIWPYWLATDFANRTGAELKSIGSLGHNIMPRGFYRDLVQWIRPYALRTARQVLAPNR